MPFYQGTLPQIAEVFYKIVIGLWPRITVAYNEATAPKMLPVDLIPTGEFIILGQNNKNTLVPKMRGVTAIGSRLARQKCDIKVMALDRSNVS